MSITPRWDSARLPEAHGIYSLLICFHEKVSLEDVCLQQVGHNFFSIPLSLLIKVQLIFYYYSVGNFLGSVCIVYSIV